MKKKLENLSLLGFDSLASYPPYEGMVSMTPEVRQAQRDLILVLLTEMIISSARPVEIYRAVKHSMVLLDAAKNNLNYVQSAIDNDIVALVQKYVNTTQEVIDSITK